MGEEAIAERTTTVDIKEPPSGDFAANSSGETIAKPQIAYRYALGFRLPANAISLCRTSMLTCVNREGHRSA